MYSWLIDSCYDDHSQQELEAQRARDEANAAMQSAMQEQHRQEREAQAKVAALAAQQQVPSSWHIRYVEVL